MTIMQVTWEVEEGGSQLKPGPGKITEPYFKNKLKMSKRGEEA
jgi:hypothetical protein